MTSGWSFGLLGNLEVRHGDVTLPVARGKLRVLLATLLLEAGRTVPFDRIVERLWDDQPPSSARATLHVYAMRLRRVLAGSEDAFDLIQTRPNGYRLEVEPAWVDVTAFHELLDQARRARATGDLAGESALLGAAMALWRGAALQDVPSESLHRTVVPRLAEERLQAVERRLEVDVELGRHAEVVGELTGLTREHPTRERFWLLLMRTLHRLGRQAEALAAYQDVRKLFQTEMGLDPGETIQELHRAILAGSSGAEPAPPAPDPLPVTPAQIPPDVRTFIGRDLYRKELMDELGSDGVPIVILSGPPGVGKTALAVHLAHRVRSSYPHGQLYVNLRGYSPDLPLAPTVALARFLRALGVPANQVPPEQEEQVSLYRSLLADRRVLILLDNAAEPSQVRPLLPNQPGCATLVTSRDDLRGLVAIDGGRQVSLGALDGPESRAVLTGMIGSTRVAAEPDAVDDLTIECGRLPLALRIAAANLQANPRLRIADYVEALRRRGRLVHLQVWGDARAGVRAAFDLSYARLDATTARLFRLLSIVPGPDFTAPVAAALTGAPLVEVEQSLDALAAASLIFAGAPRRYQFHDLLREYAASRAGEDREVPTAAARLWDFYLHTARDATGLLYPDVPTLPVRAAVAGSVPLRLTTPESALQWLDSEWPNLLAAALNAGERAGRRRAWQLADALGGYLVGRGHAAEGLAVCEAALAAAREEGDLGAEATVLDLMGQVEFVMSRYDRAQNLHGEALEISRSTGNLAGQASTLYHLGRVSAQIGPAQRSARYHRDALDIARQTGNVDAETLNINYIGVARLSAGRPDLALPWHLRALELCHRTGNQSVLARVVGALGNVAWYRGDLAVAVALYQESIELARRLGNRYGEANGLICLAEARCAAGDHAQAIADAERGIRLGRALGERRYEVGGAEVVATARFRAGQSDGVIAEYLAALDQAEEINFRFGAVSILVSLAAARRAGGDPRTGADDATRALRTMYDSGISCLEARALTELGHCHLDLGEWRPAADRLDQALAIARRGGLRLTEAHARYVYGLVERAERGPAGGPAHWRAALEMFTGMGAPEADAVRTLLSTGTDR